MYTFLGTAKMICNKQSRSKYSAHSVQWGINNRFWKKDTFFIPLMTQAKMYFKEKKVVCTTKYAFTVKTESPKPFFSMYSNIL